MLCACFVLFLPGQNQIAKRRPQRGLRRLKLFGVARVVVGAVFIFVVGFEAILSWRLCLLRDWAWCRFGAEKSFRDWSYGLWRNDFLHYKGDPPTPSRFYSVSCSKASAIGRHHFGVCPILLDLSLFVVSLPGWGLQSWIAVVRSGFGVFLLKMVNWR